MRTAVAVGVGWTALQKWLVRGTSVLTFIVLSRMLLPAEIGLVALALAFLGVLGVVADLGGAAFLVQSRSWDEPTRSTVFWTLLATATAASGLVVAVAPALADLLGEPRLAPVLQAMAPMVLLGASGAVPAAVLYRDLRFRELALREVVSAVLGAGAGIALAASGAGVWALVAQNAVQVVVGTALVWQMSAWRPTLQFSRTAFVEFRRFGVPLLGVNLMQSVRDRLELFLLGALLGVGALGYWTVAVRLLGVLVDVSVAVLDTVALPAFSAARGLGDRFVRAVESAVSSTQVLLVPALVLLAVLSPLLIPVAFGPQWQPAVQPAQVLCLAYAIAGLAYFNRAALLSHGRSGVELVLTGASLALHLGLLVAVAPYGLTALAWAFTGEAVVVAVLGTLVLRTTLGLPPAVFARGTRVVACGVLAATAALAVLAAASLDGAPALVAASAGATVVLGVLVRWTNAALLRQVADDVRRLRRPAPVA